MRKLIKSLIPANSRVFKLLSKIYRSSFKIWLPTKKPLNIILDEYSILKKIVTFVQIGSNDGISGDPLHAYIKKNQWSGILVEPVPYLFEKLKKNYASFPNELFFENSAISQNDGIQPFYRLKQSDDAALPSWYDQIGSFNKDVILSHRNLPGFDNLFIEEKIQTLSFGTLLKKHELSNVNLIHIDTEGYDFEILKLIDFNRFDLDIVIYEFVHLSLSDFKKSLNLLKVNGFELFSSALDIIAINKKIASSFHK